MSGAKGVKKGDRLQMREILGESSAVKKLLHMIERVSSARTNVLIIGESGTGKELVARMIHDSGPLNGKPFIPVNCGAIPETLIESEMFGHRRGSFTGAVAEKQGLFEVAHGGTLFLDEVGELPLSMQVKLLRAIQERSFRKVGGTEDVKVDVRIIAATNRDLEAAVAKGVFREDLYYRLNVILLKTPPLRERSGDIKVLAEAFLSKFSKRSTTPIGSFSDDAMAALEGWTWPGNVRELENVVERAVTLECNPQVEIASLPIQIAEAWLSKKPRDRVGQDSYSAVARDSSPDFSETPVARDSILILPNAIRLPAAHFDRPTDEPIDLARILREVELAYMKAALSVSQKNEDGARLLGLNARDFKARKTRLASSLNEGDIVSK